MVIFAERNRNTMEIFKVVLLAIALLALAMVGMAITILIKKGGKFPNSHVSGNKHLRDQGVYCSQTQDRIAQASVYKKVDYDHVIFDSANKSGK